MNNQTINYLLEDENNKGVKIYLSNGQEETVTKIDRGLTSSNLLAIAEPTKKIINLNYVMMLEPIVNKTASTKII